MPPRMGNVLLGESACVPICKHAKSTIFGSKNGNNTLFRQRGWSSWWGSSLKFTSLLDLLDDVLNSTPFQTHQGSNFPIRHGVPFTGVQLPHFAFLSGSRVHETFKKQKSCGK